MSDHKLKMVRRFLAFYFSPWGAAKSEIWESFTNNRPFTPASAEEICSLILFGHSFHWEYLPQLEDES